MWDDVIQLEDLAQLNLKICMDELDDAVEYLRECREKLEESLGLLRKYRE